MGDIPLRRVGVRARELRARVPPGARARRFFAWMPNSGHEAKRMEREIASFTGLIHRVCMDRKADDQRLYVALKRECDIALVTVPR